MIPLVLAAALAPVPVEACAWVRAEADTAGTGFVVDVGKRWLVTARHVVADHKAVDVFFPWVEDGRLVTDRAAYLRDRERLRRRGLLVSGSVVRLSDAADLALVELPTLPPGTPAVRLADARVGEPLRSVGNRLDLETLWNRTAGPIRQRGTHAAGFRWRGRTLAAGADVVVAQLPVDEGDSGGPAFDRWGNCVGLVSSVYRDAPDAAAVVSAAAIGRFLAVAQVGPPAAGPTAAEALQRATVWVRPTATDRFVAGALLDRGLVLTPAKGVRGTDRVGVAFGLPAGDGVAGERTAYRDPVGLYLKGVWRPATVLARDPDRDLALLQLDGVPALARPLTPTATAAAGDPVLSVNHPGGIDFAFVYAVGVVRQRGTMALADGPASRKVGVLVLQLPTQAGSPGGPVTNARGELLGVVASREPNQSTAYAADPAEVAAFLDAHDPTRHPRTGAGLAARLAAVPGRLTADIASAFAAADRPADALALDPTCPAAHFALAQATDPAAARDHLDRALGLGRHHAPALRLRAELAVRRKDWGAARGDLDRLLDVDPADAAARRRLVRVLLELGKDDDAAAAVRDTVRTDSRLVPALFRDIGEQADALETRFPGTPSVPVAWLRRALTAARDALPGGDPRTALTTALDRAATARTDADRLPVLRAALRP